MQIFNKNNFKNNWSGYGISKRFSLIILVTFLLSSFLNENNHVLCMSKSERLQLKDQVIEMFDHSYKSYMTYAFPADEIMPLSCKGRYRSLTKSRGDIDEVLGNYSLTLVDTLDTLALLGKIDELEIAVKNVLTHVSFDQDIIISVFESNIRMLGGLLGAHVSIIYLRDKYYKDSNSNKFNWYKNELLILAKDLGDRLLPAFNTTSGLPRSRVNLKYGLTPKLLNNEKDQFTCTACAGTLLLEFATLSRLTGNMIYEEKARKALEILWDKRNRASDLVGTVINIDTSEWAVKDANIGAGIDSYYEYLFKGYILLGDDELLNRFNLHYESLSKYNSLSSNDGMNIGDGSFMKTVSMNMPTRQSKSYIDSLLAFWPGIQVMKGDIKGAIKMHETLNQIVKRHDFLPEAVLFDHTAHWVGHPLRPEFLESTYYLYKATNDDYYLEVAKTLLNNLEKYSRSKCGYAAISDVRTKSNEDRMDSFVFAETFKYFYLMFAEESDMLFDLDEFVFTTEAHLLPIKMEDYIMDSKVSSSSKNNHLSINPIKSIVKSCPSLNHLFDMKNKDAVKNFRDSVLTQSSEKSCDQKEQLTSGQSIKAKNMPLRAAEFVAGRKDHMEILNKMGIRLTTMQDGRVQLVHKTQFAQTLEDAETGILFMTEMLELSKQQDFQFKSNIFLDEYRPMSVGLFSETTKINKEYLAGPAQFGYDFKSNYGLFGKLLLAEPIDACGNLQYSNDVTLVDKIIVAKRGQCTFIDKARFVQRAGGIGLIIIDNQEDTSFSASVLFSMSGDGKQDVNIPSLFLFSTEGNDLLWEMRSQHIIIAFIGDNLKKTTETDKKIEILDNTKINGAELALNYNPKQLISVLRSNLRKSKPIKFNNFITEYFHIKNSCLKYEYRILKNFYEIFNKSKPKKIVDLENLMDEENESVLVFDESIYLVYETENEKYLDINLDPITSLESQIESKNRLNNEIFTKQIFEILYSRFEKATNIGKLNNRQVYSKALFNFVSFKLNPDKSGKNLTEHDKNFLKLLADELDFNSDSSGDLTILTRKKSKLNKDGT